MLLLVEAEVAAALNWRGGHHPQRDLGYQQTAGFSIRARILPDAAVWILLISRPAWAPDRRSRRPDAIPHQAPLHLRQDEPCGGCFPARWHQTRHAGFISGSAAVSTFPFFSFGDGVRHGKGHVNSSRRCAAKITWHHRYQVSESVLISSSYLRCTLLEKNQNRSWRRSDWTKAKQRWDSWYSRSYRRKSVNIWAAATASADHDESFSISLCSHNKKLWADLVPVAYLACLTCFKMLNMFS
jgi:hypothetical protein